MIEKTPSANRREDAEWNRDHARQQQRDSHQFDRCRNSFEYAFDHRPAIGKTKTPVSPDEVGEPAKVLLGQRPVQAEGALESRDVFRTDLRIREEHGERTARDEVDESKNCRGHEEQQGDGLENAPRNETGYRNRHS